MTRGESLQWGIEIDTDGKQVFVTVHGSQRPDHTFESYEAFKDWLDEEWQGLQIARLARGGARG